MDHLEENSSKSKFTSCRQQGHVSSKSLLQQNTAVFNWRCHLVQVVLYSGSQKTAHIINSESTLTHLYDLWLV